MTHISKIGINKYHDLKRRSDLTDEEIKQIQEFEKSHRPEPTEYMKAYSESLLKEPKEFSLNLTPEIMHHNFLRGWPFLHKKDLVLSDEVQQNLKLLNRYFANDESFRYCLDQNYNESPSLDKGLLIIGGYGNGKSSVMGVYQLVLRKIPGHSFKSFTANEIVELYESCHEPYQKRHFWKQIINGRCHFDDVKTEREASNYGKVQLFKDIIERRYDAGVKTFITCNFRAPDNMHDALEEFSDMYGERVYDRLFEMFNIYHWKGKSFRK